MWSAPARGAAIQKMLLAVEADTRTPVPGAVQAHIGHSIEPKLSLVIEIRIMQEGTAVDRIAPHVVDGTLDFPFGLRA